MYVVARFFLVVMEHVHIQYELNLSECVREVFAGVKHLSSLPIFLSSIKKNFFLDYIQPDNVCFDASFCKDHPRTLLTIRNRTCNRKLSEMP